MYSLNYFIFFLAFILVATPIIARHDGGGHGGRGGGSFHFDRGDRGDRGDRFDRFDRFDRDRFFGIRNYGFYDYDDYYPASYCFFDEFGNYICTTGYGY